MKPTHLIVILLASIISSSVAQELKEDPRQTRAKIKTAHTGDSLVGTWDVEDSSARFAISKNTAGVFIEGFDQNDGEKFWLSKFFWNGESLKGKIVMPSTTHTIFVALRLVSEGVLDGEFTGDVNTKARWIRK